MGNEESYDFSSGLMTTGLFAGGYYPDYGPGDQWNPLGSTGQAFIIFDSITLNGEAVDSGDEGGATGSCDSGDCDILGAMYNGACVGWTYMPIVNGGVTLAVELNDGTTEGTENYPAINAAFDPSITFNLYDASAGTMYYNVASSSLQTGTALQYGGMDITGSGDLCSSNGAQFGPVEEYCAAGAGCELSHYADNTDAAEFDAVGTSDASCGGFTACGDASITALNSAAGAPYLNVDNSLCTYGGCLDADASNFVSNGTVDLGGCTYEAADVECSFEYVADGLGTTNLSFSAPTPSLGDACADAGGFYCGDDQANWTIYSPNGCVPDYYICDGWEDCVDAGDEAGCFGVSSIGDAEAKLEMQIRDKENSTPSLRSCGDGEWECGDGSCIPANYYCDGSAENGNASWPADCADGSDEVQGECCAAGAYDDDDCPSSFTCNGDACDGSYSFTNTSDASGIVTVVEDNGAVDAEGGSVTHATDCVYTMPTPEMTINGFTAGEGCIDTDYSGAFDFDGSAVDPICGLQAGSDYEVTVTGNNAGGSGSATGTGSTLDFECNALGSCFKIYFFFFFFY